MPSHCYSVLQLETWLLRYQPPYCRNSGIFMPPPPWPPNWVVSFFFPFIGVGATISLPRSYDLGPRFFDDASWLRQSICLTWYLDLPTSCVKKKKTPTIRDLQSASAAAKFCELFCFTIKFSTGRRAEPPRYVGKAGSGFREPKSPSFGIPRMLASRVGRWAWQRRGWHRLACQPAYACMDICVHHLLHFVLISHVVVVVVVVVMMWVYIVSSRVDQPTKVFFFLSPLSRQQVLLYRVTWMWSMYVCMYVCICRRPCILWKVSFEIYPQHPQTSATCSSSVPLDR